MSGDVVMGDNELGFRAPFRPKPVLCVCKDVVCVKVIHDVFMYDVFENFTNDGGE